MGACARTGSRCWRCCPGSAPTRSTAVSPPPTDTCTTPAFSIASMRIRRSVERPWPLSHVPLLIDGCRMEAIGGRPHPARRAARGGPGGCLWSGRVDPRGPAAGRADRRQSGIPAAAGRCRAAWRRRICASAPSTSDAVPTAAGGCSATAPRRPRAPAMRSRTAWRSRAPSPMSTAPRMSSASRRSSKPSRPSCPRSTGRTTRRVCLLTPGAMNETYFEHAYLARYLGLLLVEGEDLTVRDDGVFIRTISGLRRAEVLLRRLDADFADPLELNAASRLGVAGLVQAVRDGKVVIANALGAGLVEARAMLAFLPALAPERARHRSRAAQYRDLVARPRRRPRRDDRRISTAWWSRRPSPTQRPTFSSATACPAPSSTKRSATRPAAVDSRSRCRLCAAGSRHAVDHAGVARRPAAAAAVHAAPVPRQDRR